MATDEPAAAEENEKYTWTQNPNEIVITLPVDAAVKSADVGFKVTPHTVSLSVLGVKQFEGDLKKEVNPDESTWNLESVDGRRCVVVILEKVNRTALKKNRHWPTLWAEEEVVAKEDDSD
eukprot:TRINITY_DN67938_c0_g1_i1.p1 TRINITY_DN67938_c0_g1~~TRINITY_DN67938_c0_g1_i1.p1  ORF type:complete len:136 (-),score=32.81 TRINITY_DN67938_c0_g1_i1:56-415(-)